MESRGNRPAGSRQAQGPSFLTPKLTSDTCSFAPFISSLHPEVVKDSRDRNLPTSNQILVPPHTTAKMVKAGMYTTYFFALSLDDVDVGVHGMSTFEADAEAVCLMYGRLEW